MGQTLALCDTPCLPQGGALPRPRDEGLAPVLEQSLTRRHRPESVSLLTRNVHRLGVQEVSAGPVCRGHSGDQAWSLNRQLGIRCDCQWATCPPRVSNLAGRSLLCRMECGAHSGDRHSDRTPSDTCLATQWLTQV